MKSKTQTAAKERRHQHERQKHHKKRNKHLLVAFFCVALLAVIVWIPLAGMHTLQNIYYGHRAGQELTKQSNALGSPLSTLGFTNISSTTSCVRQAEAYESGRPLHCTANQKSYMVFTDSETKKTAVAAAAKLQTSLQQQGWKHGDHPVANWVKQVLSGRDWNPDSYNYHYDGHTFCVLDLYVAFANPKPPAVQAEFYCTTPKTQPPIM